MFGWGRRGRRAEADERDQFADVDEPDDRELAVKGPFDEQEAPSDGVERLDLGSVRFPVPEGSQLQVEVDPSGPVRAVHLVTDVGRITVSGFAAPKTSDLWPEVSNELADQLRADGAKVYSVIGDWGAEIVADSPKAMLRFVGVDGPRWMLRGVAAGPSEHSEACTKLLYALLEETVVVRGDEPLPVRTPLPIELPESIAKHIQQAQAGEQATS
ncbi:DUF3710 domain-containing protein [Parasphingorhabdus pacifica]